MISSSHLLRSNIANAHDGYEVPNGRRGYQNPGRDSFILHPIRNFADNIHRFSHPIDKLEIYQSVDVTTGSSTVYKHFISCFLDLKTTFFIFSEKTKEFFELSIIDIFLGKLPFIEDFAVFVNYISRMGRFYIKDRKELQRVTCHSS